MWRSLNFVNDSLELHISKIQALFPLPFFDNSFREFRRLSEEEKSPSTCIVYPGVVMNYVSFDDIEKYCTCPYKIKFKDKKRVYSSSSLLENSVLKGVYSYFHNVALGKQDKEALTKAIEAFNCFWNENLDNTIDTKEKKSYLGHFIYSRISSCYDPEKEKILYVNLPIEIRIKDFFISDNIDLVLEDKETKNIRLISFKTIRSNSKIFLEIKLFLYKIYLSEIINISKRHISFEICPLNGDDKFYVPMERADLKLGHILRSVKLGIQNKIYFPIVNKNTCNECEFKYMCKMRCK